MFRSSCPAVRRLFNGIIQVLAVSLILLSAAHSGKTAWAGQSYSCAPCDFDHDGDIDQSDFGALQACFSGSGKPLPNPACQLLVLDGDADIDADDLQFFAACATGPSETVRPGRLFITELMASNAATIRDPDEVGDSYPDWIELYNDDSDPRDLGGLYLTNNLSIPNLWQIPAGVQIGGGQRLVFWADNDTDQGPHHTNFKLSKDGAAVGLFASDGTTQLDAVTFGPLGTDVSWGRLPDTADHWRAFQGPDAPPTPGEPNSATIAVPKIILNEIMYHPYAALNQPEPVLEEYIELYNAGPTAINMTGWKFSSGIQFDFPDGTTVGGGEYLVVAANLTAFLARHPGVAPVVGGWTKRLSNDSEDIGLVDAAGRLVDGVSFADEGDWAVRQRGLPDHGHNGWIWYDASDGLGASLELINPALSRQYGHNWAASTVTGGTPGGPNSVFSSDMPPIIGNVDQSPVIPHSDQPVQITAEVIDELKTGDSVQVYYRRDGTASFTAVELLDDGAHNDGVAGNGVFGGVLPAQPNGTIVEYYFEATDAAGHVRRQPAFALPSNTPLANRLYQVDDTFDPVWTTGRQPIYYIIMTAAERTELADIGDSNTDGVDEQESNAQMNGTFVSIDADGVKARYNVGVRNRGKGSRTGPPNNYRINFVSEHTWNGMTQLDINCRYAWLQRIGNQLFEAAGLVTADTKLLQVRVNGQNLSSSGRVMYGSYLFLEPYDGNFADQHFPGDGNGNVYRCIGWVGSPQQFADLTYLGTDPTPYRVTYSKDTHGSEENWSDLIHLTDVLTNAPAATYEQDIAAVINVDQWLRWFAAQTLIGNAETNLGNGVGDDYSLYSGVDDPRFVILPHDFDTVLGTGNGTPAKTTDSIWLPANTANMKRFLQHPAFCHRYYQQIRDLRQTAFSPAQFDLRVDNLLAGTPAVAEAAAIKKFNADRTAFVAAQIPAALTIQSELPIVAGHKYATQNMALLSGQGNAYDTRSIRVNGLDATWDPVTGTWKIGSTGSLIAKGSKWHFLDNTPNAPPAGWQSVKTNDPWPEQNARLGYGGDGETQPQLKYGPDASNKYITYYFRRVFEVGDPAQFTGLKLHLLRDDGAAVYLNGTKLALPQTVDNMPDAFTNTTLASSTVGNADEQTYFEADLFSQKNLLISNAINVIAVEIHQSVKDSSDLGFDMELVAEGAAVSSGVPLAAGLNHVLVQAFDGPGGTGNEVERGTIDIFYDDQLHNVLSGTLNANKTLDAAMSPWHVTGNVIVPAGITLTIEPGVTVFFETGTGLTVNGKLIAQGTDAAHIVLTRAAGSTGTWSGVAFNNTLQANVLSYVDQSYGDGQGHSVGVFYSRLLLDHVDWTGVSTTMLEVEHPSIMVQNCIVPGAGDKELFHGVYISGSEYFIIQNTTFGMPTGYNDVIDFSGCKRPGPILQVYGCTFLGGADDGLDLDGTDAHVEGNFFTNFHKGSGNPGTSNAVSTGLRFDLTSDIVVVRNIFVNNDHATLLKEDCFARFEHNTVVDCAIAVINFGEPERGYTPGRGASLDGNILYGYPLVFQNVTLNPGLQLTMNRTLVAASEHSRGVGNIDANPLFVNSPTDLHLQPGSPAIGKGINGLDLGAYVPGGASISGAPNGISSETTATLNIWGPGVIQYQYRVRDNGVWGGWSADVPINSPVNLTGLQDGHSYAVEVVGRNSAGVLEAESEGVTSPTWVVDTTP